MKSIITAALAALVGITDARLCANFTIPVTISARLPVFNQTTPSDNIDVLNFALNLTQQGVNYTEQVLAGYRTASGTYNIAATYCHPNNVSANTVQVLTHGIGFDRSYWDFSYNNYNYSYVAEAVDQYGFSTFSWDRLGIGMSQRGEPVNEVQALLEVEALRALTQMLRDGAIECTGNKKFHKIVHVGHSFGSDHTYRLTAMYPNISDGIALTGWSQNGSFVPYFALGGNFIQANTIPALSTYPNGYLASGDASAVQNSFFSPGMFDPAVLDLAYTTGAPVTVGELLTVGSETALFNDFSGPVLVITGERDVPFCGSNCLAAPTGFDSVPQQALIFLPNAKNPQTVIVPNAGHGLNLDYSHPFTYDTINNYFVQNGLGP